MKYTKLPISFTEQIAKLKQRGLQFEDEAKAEHYLSNISYYRLRAYTYPFQDNKHSPHLFIRPIYFEQIIDLYVFDRQLRLLLFNAIEKIEVALRTQIIHHYALAYGSHWHIKPELFNNLYYFQEHTDSLQKEIDRSNEAFIKHYKATYTQPLEPACWMSLEVSSMGLLSKIFANLKKDSAKDAVTRHFGLKDADLLANWMFCISILRNTCAHHARVWNRRLPPIQLIKKVVNPYINDKNIYTNKLYAYACNIAYILNIISPNHSFKERFLELIDNCPLSQAKEMGFPSNWKDEAFWQ
jgi:abortive infection bacteriophage resistance protein